jgi:hypothetical protein
MVCLAGVVCSRLTPSKFYKPMLISCQEDLFLREDLRNGVLPDEVACIVIKSVLTGCGTQDAPSPAR